MEDFVSFELAKKLREKGFDLKEPFAMYNELGVFHKLYSSAEFTGSYDVCYRDYYSYDDFDERDFVAPTISQVLKWLRKEKDLHMEIVASAYGYSYIINKTPFFGGSEIKSSEFEGPNDGGAWDEWEDAALAGIEYVLDLI